MDAQIRRLNFYAGLVAAHSLLVVGVLTGVIPDVGGTVVVVSAVALLLAFGPYQADVALNGDLDEVSRSRWRIGLYCFPWATVAYWATYVRPRQES